jgi:hypothetical protein
MWHHYYNPDFGSDPDRCCETCLGCSLARKRIQHYKEQQDLGIYHYAIANGMTLYLRYVKPFSNSGKNKPDAVHCQVFSDISELPNLDSKERSDPYVLAYTEIYRRGIIETFDDPDLVVLGRCRNGTDFECIYTKTELDELDELDECQDY